LTNGKGGKAKPREAQRTTLWKNKGPQSVGLETQGLGRQGGMRSLGFDSRIRGSSGQLTWVGITRKKEVKEKDEKNSHRPARNTIFEASVFKNGNVKCGGGGPKFLRAKGLCGCRE